MRSAAGFPVLAGPVAA